MSKAESGLPHLTEFVVPTPVGIDTATMLIASMEPGTLDHVVNGTCISDAILEKYAVNTLTGAQQTRDMVMRSSTDESTRTSAEEYLLEAAQIHQQFQEERRAFADDVTLAREVQRKQIELSRPLRWITGVTLTLGIGGVAAAVTYEAEQFDAVSAVQLYQHDNEGEAPGHKLPLPDGNMQSRDYVLAGLVGVVGAIKGKRVANRISDTHTARFAHMRAKREVRKAS